MNTIILRDTVLLADDSRTITLEISKGGVLAQLDNLHRVGWNREMIAIPWDKITDVEFLAEQFDEETVRTFKRVCEMLAQINANRHIYEVLV